MFLASPTPDACCCSTTSRTSGAGSVLPRPFDAAAQEEVFGKNKDQKGCIMFSSNMGQKNVKNLHLKPPEMGNPPEIFCARAAPGAVNVVVGRVSDS